LVLSGRATQASMSSGAGGSASNSGAASKGSSACGGGVLRGVEGGRLRGQSQVFQDPLDARPLGHGCHDRHPSRTTVAREDVLQEHPPDEGGPREPAWPARRLGPRRSERYHGLGGRGLPVRSRWHDLGSRREGWSQDAVVTGQMCAGSGHDGHESLDELVGGEPKGDGAVAPGALEPELDAPSSSCDNLSVATGGRAR
jgi:hypothetical protein